MGVIDGWQALEKSKSGGRRASLLLGEADREAKVRSWTSSEFQPHRPLIRINHVKCIQSRTI